MQVRIRKSEPAAFQGILIPEAMYRQMDFQISKADILESRLKECELDRAISEPMPDHFDRSIWFTSGIAVGLISSIVLFTRK